MALIIETGDGVTDANSYATLAEWKSFAALRGIAVPTDAAIEAALIQAADYIESLEDRFKGDRVLADQALAWPRQNVYLFGSSTALDDDYIPPQLKTGQNQLAADAIALGGSLMPNGSGRQVVREKVDVLEVEYANTKSSSVLPVFNKALSFLAPLFGNGGMTVKTIRV